MNLNTAVVAISSYAAKNETDVQQHEAMEDVQDAIAVATANLGLLPGVAFQARVLQLAHLSNVHQSVCTYWSLYCCMASDSLHTLTNTCWFLDFCDRTSRLW